MSLTNNTFSIAVMSAESRKEFRSHLIAQLEREQIKDYALIVDSEQTGIWPTARRAWQSYHNYSGVTHHLVLQDDVQICSNFLSALDHLITLVSNKPLILCGTIQYPMQTAIKRGGHWIESNIVRYGQAIMLPVKMIDSWLEWDKNNVAMSYPYDDTRLEMYFMHENLTAMYPVPSLVQHNAPYDGTLKNVRTNTHRIAQYFIGEADPMKIDWETGLKNPPKQITRFLKADQRVALNLMPPSVQMMSSYMARYGITRSKVR